ncbi:hypothetical protein M8R20_13300, partial [Pseudomonas sp. R2.Fl]|nr:hypothetical protein [Pseudomonas sp. R2.Fl]
MSQQTESGQTADARPAIDPELIEPYIVKDPQAMAMNAARALENLGKAASEWLRPRERGEIVDPVSEPVTQLVKTMSKVAEYWMSDPKRTLEAQSLLLNELFGIWMKSLQKLSGEQPAESAPSFTDKRFADEDWQKNPFFDFLRQAYVAVSAWAEK